VGRNGIIFGNNHFCLGSRTSTHFQKSFNGKCDVKAVRLKREHSRATPPRDNENDSMKDMTIDSL